MQSIENKIISRGYGKGRGGLKKISPSLAVLKQLTLACLV
jgi:hypothetical protein